MGIHHRAFFHWVIHTVVRGAQAVGGLEISMVFLRGMFNFLLNRLVEFCLCDPCEPLQYRLECSVWYGCIVGELLAQFQQRLVSVTPATVSMFLLFALCQ